MPKFRGRPNANRCSHEMPDAQCHVDEHSWPGPGREVQSNAAPRIEMRVCATKGKTWMDLETARLRINELDLSCKLTLRTVSGAHADTLALPQLTNSKAAKGLHVHKYVWSFGSARYESIPLFAIEPFDDRFKCLAGCLANKTLRSVSHRRVGLSGGVVQRDQAPSLQPAGTLHGFAYDPGPFIGCFEAGLPDAGLMQQDVPSIAI